MTKEKKEIYVVDDDASICRALKYLLTTFGFVVSTFLCAEEFLNTVSKDAKGCLILDIHMPGLDGRETLKRMIKSGFHLPVIMISADKNEGLREKVLRIGAVGFLQKPFNDQELVDLINAMP